MSRSQLTLPGRTIASFETTPEGNCGILLQFEANSLDGVIIFDDLIVFNATGKGQALWIANGANTSQYTTIVLCENFDDALEAASTNYDSVDDYLTKALDPSHSSDTIVGARQLQLQNVLESQGYVKKVTFSKKVK